MIFEELSPTENCRSQTWGGKRIVFGPDAVIGGVYLAGATRNYTDWELGNLKLLGMHPKHRRLNRTRPSVARL